MTTQPPAPGYRPVFHMPVIGPPPTGDDPTTFYNEVSLATTVEVTAADHQGLLIKLSNADYSQLFAMSGGLVRFVPAGHPLPTSEGETAQGSGALVLETWIDDVNKLKSALPPGVPAMTYVLYLNVKPEAVLTGLRPHVQVLKDSVLKLAWNQPIDPPGRAELETNFLDRLLLGETTVFVPGGTLIGEAAKMTTDTASDRVFVFRFTDSAGNDLSPVLHLRGMEGYGGPQWHDHPLIKALSNIPVPVNIYLRFEVWNETSHAYEPLPAGVAVELKDQDSEFDVEGDLLITELTDAQGGVHFSTSLEQLDALDPDDAETDLYFLVRTAGLTHAGHTLPEKWSTKGWKATDGSPGYYENFTGSQIGAAAAPLVFRIGFDFHVRFSYEDRSRTGTVTVNNNSTTVNGAKTNWKPYLVGTSLKVLGDPTAYNIVGINQSAQTMTLSRPYAGGSGGKRSYRVCVNVLDGIPVTLMVNGAPRRFLKTNQSGEVSGVVFNIEGEDTIHFIPSYEIEDPGIQLPRAEVVGWSTFHTDAEDLRLPDNQLTSLRTPGGPYSFCYSDPDRCAAFYILKLLKELSTFLFYMTRGNWTGVPDLRFFLKTIVNHSHSWPVKQVKITSIDHFDRATIIHEISHQVMWKEVNFSTLGIAYEGTLGELELKHRLNLLFTPEHALIEGWPAFMEAVFEGAATPPYSVQTLVDKDGNHPPLGPPPNDIGESVEGAFANGLWGIFANHVHNAHVLESADGDVTTTSNWIQSTSVQQRFIDMIWNPLKDLRPLLNPDSTRMLNAISLRNPEVWHVLRAELQAHNMSIKEPGITSISPSGGPQTGGQSIFIFGTDFVQGMTVKIGGRPATNVFVGNSAFLTAVTPAGTAGPADVVITLINPQAGSFTLPQGYVYLD